MKPAAKRGAKAPRKAAPAKKAKKKQAVKPKVLPVTKTERRADRFVSEYLIDLNGRQAAIRAGYSPDTARQIASELLAKPEIQKAVDAKQAELLKGLGVTTELVLSRLQAIATADPRELTELHRGCCRYCWGKDNLFQRTPREMRESRIQWEADEAARAAKEQPPKPFDVAGGEGFNPKRDPNPSCPECWGDGDQRVVFKDTRDLSPAARLLFAGVEQTQNGLKVRTHSQPDALVNIGKHLGMFTKKVEHSGPDGGPIKQEHRAMGDLLDMIDGSDTGPGAAASRR
jgi:phage terminase small subunit